MAKSINAILVVLAAVLLVPAASHAAGLGTITVRSALGQPLDAEIEVVAVQPGEDIQVRLASREAYQNAGIDLSPALQGARFAVERRDGRTIIRVRTSQPVNDPFFSVLVELQSPTGRLSRQYTVLVDPAEYRVASTPSSQEAAAAPSPAPVSPTPAPVRAQAQPPKVAAGKASGPAPAAPAPAAQPLVVAQPTTALAQPLVAAAQPAPAAKTAEPVPVKPTVESAPVPAATSAAPAAAIVQPAAPAPAPVQPIAVPVAPTQTPQAAIPPAPVPQAQIQPSVVAPAPVAQVSSPPAPATPAAAPAQQNTEVSDAYQIRRGDTLGVIARKWKPEGVSYEQMLVGLFQTNRSVFIRDNINLIRAGATLFIPSRDDVLAINAADAARQVRTHMAVFTKYRDTTVSAGAGSGRISQAHREAISRRGVVVKRSTRAM